MIVDGDQRAAFMLFDAVPGDMNFANQRGIDRVEISCRIETKIDPRHDDVVDVQEKPATTVRAQLGKEAGLVIFIAGEGEHP